MPDYSTWSFKELRKEDRRWGVHDMNATEVRAEIARRYAQWKHWGMLAGVFFTAVAAVAAVAAYFHSN
jgi:hypothetical protein